MRWPHGRNKNFSTQLPTPYNPSLPRMHKDGSPHADIGTLNLETL
ncbi:MAG: hypothetical protein AMXMBFR4_27020 [Candidatus Hydrogenedentota bacterium]